LKANLCKRKNTSKGSNRRRRSNYAESIRRSKNRKRVNEYEKKLFEVQNLNEGVAGDREVQVLNWMLDGKSQRWIGLHMALSATSIKHIKHALLR